MRYAYMWRVLECARGDGGAHNRPERSTQASPSGLGASLAQCIDMNDETSRPGGLELTMSWMAGIRIGR